METIRSQNHFASIQALATSDVLIMATLPNILLSGFMFPFSGMPQWAQWIGEALPLTHYLRVTRGILLKGSDFADVARELAFLAGLMMVAMGIAVTRFRQTLD